MQWQYINIEKFLFYGGSLGGLTHLVKTLCEWYRDEIRKAKLKVEVDDLEFIIKRIKPNDNKIEESYNSILFKIILVLEARHGDIYMKNITLGKKIRNSEVKIMNFKWLIPNSFDSFQEYSDANCVNMSQFYFDNDEYNLYIYDVSVGLINQNLPQKVRDLKLAKGERKFITLMGDIQLKQQEPLWLEKLFKKNHEETGWKLILDYGVGRITRKINPSFINVR